MLTSGSCLGARSAGAGRPRPHGAADVHGGAAAPRARLPGQQALAPVHTHGAQPTSLPFDRLRCMVVAQARKTVKDDER